MADLLIRWVCCFSLISSQGGRAAGDAALPKRVLAGTDAGGSRGARRGPQARGHIFGRFCVVWEAVFSNVINLPFLGLGVHGLLNDMEVQVKGPSSAQQPGSCLPIWALGRSGLALLQGSSPCLGWWLGTRWDQELLV